MSDIDCIRDQISHYPGSKVGFVIYRLTYSDNEQWDRFMSHLHTRVRTILENYGDGDIFTHVDWMVQEDPELDEARFESDDEIYSELRKRHADFLNQHPEENMFSVPRSQAFIAVTQDHVNWVLEGPEPEQYSRKESFLELVALDPEDGEQSVSLSLVFPRAYSLIDGIGFDHIRTGEEGVFSG